MKKTKAVDLKKNVILTTNEYEVIISEEGKLYFVKKSKVGEYLGNTEYNEYKVGKGYTKGKLSDGTEIIYPTNDLDDSRVEITVKAAYVAYVACMEAKKQGKVIDFSTALAYYASNPKAAEAASELIGKELNDERGIEIWKPNYTFIEGINETLKKDDAEPIDAQAFIDNEIPVTEDKKPVAGDKAHKKAKRKAFLKKNAAKVVVGIVSLALITVLTLGIIKECEQKKNPAGPGPANPSSMVYELEDSIESMFKGSYTHYEIRDNKLYVCESMNAGQQVLFGELTLGKNYPAADKFTEDQKKEIAKYIQDNKTNIKEIASFNTESDETIKIVRENEGTTKTITLNKITKGENPFNKDADEGTITIIGTPKVSFNRNSETTYRTSVDVYGFSGYDQNGNMSSTKYTIYSDCAKDISEDEQYKLLAENGKVESSTLMENYSPAGMFKGVEMQVKAYSPSKAENVITSGEYVSTQRDLYKAGILKSTEIINEEVAEANGVKYFLVKDTADKTNATYLYAVEYNMYGDIGSHKKYIDASNISKNKSGIKLVSDLINEQTWGTPIYVELLPAEEKNDGKIISHLNIVTFRKDEADKVYEVRSVANAVEMESKDKEYSKAEMLDMYIAMFKGGYVSVGADQRSFSKEVAIESAKAPAKSENGGMGASTGLSKE